MENFIDHMLSPLGLLRITGTEAGITSLITVEDATTPTLPHPIINECKIQLGEYFEGRRTKFSLPLAPAGTDFQKEIWKLLAAIPFGERISYAALSQRFGDPLAIRAVAAANGKNKIWIIVPCHRVIGSDGSLTGYAGGLAMKRWLLEHEARIAGHSTMQMQMQFT